MRGRVDLLQRAVLQQLEVLGRRDRLGTLRAAQERFRQTWGALVEARALVDRRIAGETGAISTVQWVDAMSNYIDGLSALRQVALGARRDTDRPVTDNPLTKEISYTLIEYAGRERAQIGTVLAMERPFTPAELGAVQSNRSITGETMRKLDMVIRRMPANASILAAREAVQQEYQERYIELRKRIFLASERGEPYPVDADTWFRAATAAINTIVVLSERLSGHALEDVMLVQQGARRDVAMAVLAGGGILAILLTTVLLIHRRAVHPLRRLAHAANTIATGNLQQPVTNYYPDELGEVAGAFEHMRTVLLEDAEQRSLIEQKLLSSESRFRNMVESTDDWVWEVNDKGQYLYVSPQVEKILGYRPDELIGRTPFDLMPPDEARRFGNLFFERQGVHAPLRALENVNRHKDGHLVVLETSGVPFFDEHDRLLGYRGIDRDITARSQAEQQLRRSEARYRAIFESLQDVYFRATMEGHLETISPSVTAMTGYTVDEAMQMSALPFYADANEHTRMHQALLEKGQLHDYELKARHKDGYIIYVSMNVRLLRDAEDHEVIEGLVRDISVRKQAEEEMHKMTLVLEQTADLITITDRNGRIEYVNRAFERITGYQQEEIVGEPSSVLSSGQQSPDFYRRLWETLEQGETFHGLFVNRKKNGELFDEEKTITPVRNTEGEIIHYVSTGKDVTAKRQMEAQIQQSEKLASIGQLAAGVAHEINNPVGYINSNIGSLKHYLDDLFELLTAYEEAEAAIADPSLREQIHALRQRLDIDFLKNDIQSLVDESQEGVKRVKTIVQDLKDFSRADSTEYDWADLHQGLNSTLNIVHNELKYKAEIIKEFGELPLVECVASQINQVFMNLLVNAAHAIEEHGTITIRTGTEGDERVWMEVEDSGKGIPQENLNHIFDPFFTTKPVGKGTGLGLSLSYGIVQKHGGTIEVESEVGKGTRFRVVLPIRQATHGEEAATTSQAALGGERA